MKKYLLLTVFVPLSFFGMRAYGASGPLDVVQRGIAEIGLILEQQNMPVDADSIKSEVLDTLIKSIDPKAVIITERQARRILEEKHGVFYGVGMSIGIEENRPVVVGINENSPAAESGVAEGDIIERIDGISTEGMVVEDLVDMLRGDKGEIVELEVRGRDDEPELRAVTIVRDIVRMSETGTMEEWPYGIGYIRINGLYEGSGEQIVCQMEIWSEEKYYGGILDLRDAQGGDLDSVVHVAELFTDEDELLFSVRDGGDGVVNDYRAKGGVRFDMPIMVLINRQTSGASEVLAAVLRHRGGVLLIGSASSGDDRIREAVPLSDGNMLYIATRRIHLAKQPSYHGNGVAPDIVVSETVDHDAFETKPDEYGFPLEWSENERDSRALMARVSNDSVLRRATDILLGVRALGILVK